MLSDRIKEVRKYFHLSQTAFGERVGASIDVIKNLEYGRAKPNETLLAHICTIYGIDEHWLRTGEGEMFAGKSAEDIAIENAIRDAGSSPAIRALLVAYSRLNDQNRAVFEKFVEDYVSEYEAQTAAESAARDDSVFDDPASIPEAK